MSSLGFKVPEIVTREAYRDLLQQYEEALEVLRAIRHRGWIGPWGFSGEGYMADQALRKFEASERGAATSVPSGSDHGRASNPRSESPPGRA